MPMKLSRKGLMEIISHEAIVPMPYRDSVGVWTWGIGHTAAAGPPDPATMKKGSESNLADCIEVFRRDLSKYESRVNQAVKVPLAQHEFDALVSFDFNTGGIFKAQITKHLNNGDRAAATAAFMGWVKPPEIKERRRKEQRLFGAGTYSAKGMASVCPADANGKVLWSRGRRIDVSALLGAATDPEPAPPPIVEGLGEPDPPPAPKTVKAPVAIGTAVVVVGGTAAWLHEHVVAWWQAVWPF